MKILLIPSWYPNINNPNLGYLFKEQAELLVQNGYEVKVLFGNINRHKDYFKIKKRKVRDKIQLNQNFLLQNPPAFSFDININSKRNEDEQFKEFCKFYRIAYSKFVTLYGEPNFILAQSTVDGGLAAHHLGTRFNVSYGIIEHQTFNLLNYSSHKRERIMTAIVKANKIAAVSNHQKRCMLMNNINTHISIIENFVDDNVFKPIKKSESKIFKILTVTYNNKVKDPDTFFRAIKSFLDLNKKEINVAVTIVCAYYEEDIKYFKNLIKKFDIEDICNLIGPQNRQDIVKMMQDTDVFISTSISETFGLAIREAMLCGAITISTKSGGVEDCINEQTGFVVDIGDYFEIARILNHIKENEITFNQDLVKAKINQQSSKEQFLNKMHNFFNN